jgi:hypothetical protein
VCTYFVAKWVEVKTPLRSTEQAVVDFLFQEIFTRFCVPREIVIDLLTIESIRTEMETSQGCKSPCVFIEVVLLFRFS